MISDEEILQLMSDLESDRVERKRSPADRTGICDAICAFANDMPNHRRPGIVIVGQNDDGSVSKVTISDKTMREIAAWRSDGHIHPFPTMQIRRMEADGWNVVLIIVEPSSNPPVKFDGKTRIRVGPRRDIATAEEEARLIERRVSGALPFDARGLAGTTIADIDLSRFTEDFLPTQASSDALSQDARSPEQQLRALNLIDKSGLATPSGILLVGKSPLSIFPGAYVQALRIDGTELTDQILDHKTISGTLPEQIRRVDELFDLWITHGITVGGERAGHQVDYPVSALRQVFRNAEMHRAYLDVNAPIRITWYNDRVEISNPGGPYGSVTIDNFGQPGITDYRNPTIAMALKSLGYVEKFGIGIAITRRECERNGNPPPEFDVYQTYIGVTIRKAK